MSCVQENANLELQSNKLENTRKKNIFLEGCLLKKNYLVFVFKLNIWI